MNSYLVESVGSEVGVAQQDLSCVTKLSDSVLENDEGLVIIFFEILFEILLCSLLKKTERAGSCINYISVITCIKFLYDGSDIKRLWNCHL